MSDEISTRITGKVQGDATVDPDFLASLGRGRFTLGFPIERDERFSDEAIAAMPGQRLRLTLPGKVVEATIVEAQVTDYGLAITLEHDA